MLDQEIGGIGSDRKVGRRRGDAPRRALYDMSTVPATRMAPINATKQYRAVLLNDDEEVEVGDVGFISTTVLSSGMPLGISMSGVPGATQPSITSNSRHSYSMSLDSGADS